MTKIKHYKLIIWIVSILLSILFLTTAIIKPLIGKKLESALNENQKYQVKFKKLRFSIISSSLELKGISLISLKHTGSHPALAVEIASIHLSGIKLVKFLLWKDISIREIIISGGELTGSITPPRKPGKPIIIPFNISIGSILIDKTDISLGDTSSARKNIIRDGILKVDSILVSKNDTLSLSIIHNIDLTASEYISVSSDSMYSFIANDITYSTTSKILASSKFAIHPNYSNYNFTSRHKYQADCIEAELSNIYVRDFNVLDYMRSRNIISSYIEIKNLEMKSFRDMRKELKHVKKKTFQDMIYNYTATLNIDSIKILNGNIRYTEHSKNANESGTLTFEKIKANFFRLTNDPVYKTKPASFDFSCDALLMGTGNLHLRFKAPIFDQNNTFSLSGALSEMETKELNPYFEKSTSMYITSGKIDRMKFSFQANNTKASGNLTILYHNLEITIKNKHTDDTTGLKEKFLSLILNRKIRNSNPLPGEEARVGVIDYERDPEKFILNYWVKSVLSGIKSSLIKTKK